MNLVGFLFLAGWAIFFLVPGGYGITAWLLLAVGAHTLVRRARGRDPERINWGHLLPFLVWGVVTLGIMLFHSERPNTIEQTLPYLLAPVLYAGLQQARFSLHQFCVASAIAAIGSGVLAMGILLTATGPNRVVGLMSNHIAYGNLSALFGLISLFGMATSRVSTPDAADGKTVLASRLAPTICFLGGVMGISASLASGTKGGWISVVSIGGFLAVQLLRNHGRKAFVPLVSFLGLLAIWILVVPNNVFVGRIDHAVGSIASAVSGGTAPTDGSIGARWAMITQGYDVYINSSSWLLGVDRTSLLHEVSERISPLVLGVPYADIPNLHNEVMDTLATRGVIGLLAYFALYGGIAWLAFRPGSPDGRRSLLLMVLVAYLEFGLSNVQFEVGSLRLAFVILMLALLSRAR